MKIKLSVLVNTVFSLDVLLGQKIPVKTSYKLAKLTKQIKEEISIYDDVKKKLVDAYGTIEKGSPEKMVYAGSEHHEKVTSELNDILSTEIDLNFDVLNIEELGNIDIEPVHLYALEYLFA